MFGHGRKFAKVRRGRDACGMFRQSRSLTDSTGAVWWGDLWSGSLGRVRAGLFRCDAERYVVVWQSRIGLDRTGVARFD